MGAYITVPEAAKRLGITRQAVHKLVRLGRVRADKIGRDWLIPEPAVASRCNRIRKPIRRGFSLIEVALSLGIAGLALVAMEQGADDANRQVKDAAAADSLSQVYTAAQQYIQANPAALGASPAVGTTQVMQVGRTSSTGTIPTGSLQALGFLPSDYINSNAYGQQHVVVLKEAANDVIEALVETTGGAIIGDVDLGRIAAKVGANGGVVDSNPPPGITAGTMQGTGGGWSEAATNWTSGGYTPTAGHAIAVSYATQTDILQPWLYRNVVPGQPEANRMHTAIDMTHNNLNAVADINNTDATTGVDAPITVDSELVGNTTNGNQVNFQNGLFACKGNKAGCQLQVSDDGGFVDNNNGWVTFKGTQAAADGFRISGTSDNLLVDGTTTTTGVTNANGGLVAQDYIQSYGDVQMKRTATHLAALVWPDASGNWSGGAYFAPDTSKGVANLLRVYGGSLWTDSNNYAAIYYDAANSAYFVQPSQTSVLNNLDVNSVTDYGTLQAGNGSLNVYYNSSLGSWVLGMTGYITASQSILAGGAVSAGTNVTAGQAVTAGTSISAGTSVYAGTTMEAAGNITSDNGNITASNGTVTGTKGVITLASATSGATCSTNGEIAQDSGGVMLDSCESGVWRGSMPFTHQVSSFDNAITANSGTAITEDAGWHQNKYGVTLACTAYSQNYNQEYGVRISTTITGSPQSALVNAEGYYNATESFIVPPGQEWDTVLGANYDGGDLTGQPAVSAEVYYACWY